jgi:hypothetical protein
MEPSELLDDNTRLVGYIQELPYQEGRPLAPLTKEMGDAKLVDYFSSSKEYSPECQVRMASIRNHDDDDEPGNQYDNELLAEVFADENMANVPQDKDEERRRVCRARNSKPAKRRWNVEAHAR